MVLILIMFGALGKLLIRTNISPSLKQLCQNKKKDNKVELIAKLVEQAKIIASNYEVTDGPDSDGEMFTRPARLSDNFVGPYPNEQAATAANGGAYPPDMSVLVKARKGGADYIYSVLLGYDEPPAGMTLDDGVYYNTYMAGNII